ncbi:MAG TPA: cyclase family protein [Candidatus Krumholzibacteria bacterium]|nr:cyclase family protein [Candidatus Krumholzibacteria bacterium]HPD73249.1 cyclase family protein [Candidatus Krumholzibacteria bacterium]HRY40211.1 cyclase family protein [Candidatus Krumholzibacteria bacterium]
MKTSSGPATRRIVDLTHPLATGMPVYPGTESPEIAAAFTVAEHGFLEHRLTLVTHTGTHLDVPAHMLADGRTLDSYPAGHFVGEAFVIDVSGAPGGAIARDLLTPYRDVLARCDFALLHTGWSRRWGLAAYFEGFPVLDPDAARWLAGLDLRGVGVDAVSVDPAGAAAFPVHEVLLGRELVIVENLTNLGGLVGREFTLCCLPLKITGADGAPVRAVAILAGE